VSSHFLGFEIGSNCDLESSYAGGEGRSSHKARRSDCVERNVMGDCGSDDKRRGLRADRGRSPRSVGCETRRRDLERGILGSLASIVWVLRLLRGRMGCLPLPWAAPLSLPTSLAMPSFLSGKEKS